LPPFCSIEIPFGNLAASEMESKKTKKMSPENKYLLNMRTSTVFEVCGLLIVTLY
jgi:hypothetical protein